MGRAAATLHQRISAQLQAAAALHAQLGETQIALIARAGEAMAEAMRQGRKIIWFGNGGSATQSQHMAGEFVGRFQHERRSLPSLSLVENMASVTAIGNDFAFEHVFTRQLEGLGQAGDVAVGLSTSGNSPNVVQALQKARAMKMVVIGLTGASGGQMDQVCEICIRVPSTSTARIQEAHLTIGHILCGMVEDALLADGSA